MIDRMEHDLDRLAAEHSFSGVIGIERNGELATRAYGLADRAHGVASTAEQRRPYSDPSSTTPPLSDNVAQWIRRSGLLGSSERSI